MAVSEDDKNRQADADSRRQQKAQRELVASKTIKEKGLLMVHTGDGKGKSTAAFGLAVRALGQGLRVAVVQFIKGTWKTGEKAAFARFGDLMEWRVVGDGFTWDTQNRAQDMAAAAAGWAQVVELIESCRGPAPKFDMIVVDELNIILRYDYLDVASVLPVLRDKPENLHLVITGRDAKPEIMEIADLVTEMKAVKHPFDAGVRAQRGIEF